MMFTEIVGSIGTPIITIVLVWVATIAISQIIKISTIKSLRQINPDIPVDHIHKAHKVAHIIATAIAMITAIVFVVFMSNWNAKSDAQTEKIQQVPLPENFKEATKEEILVSNHRSVSTKPVTLKREAKEDNDKAMEEASKLFNVVK